MLLVCVVVCVEMCNAVCAAVRPNLGFPFTSSKFETEEWNVKYM